MCTSPDVRKLLPAGLMTDELASRIAQVYNTKNGRVITAPSGSRVVLGTAGEDGDKFVDPTTGSLFEVDHLSMTAKESTSIHSVDSVLELKRAALQESLTSYKTSKYSAEEAAASAYVKGDKVIVLISGEKANLRNFWSGRWASWWTITVEGGKAKIEGEIKIHAHYFEDGNIQLQTTKTVPSTTVSFSSDAEFAKVIVDNIKTIESALQEGLETMYSNMNEETFKSMRRIMPITKTKMEWNVNSVRMVRQVHTQRK